MVAGLENERRNILLPRTKCVIQYDLKKKKTNTKKIMKSHGSVGKFPVGL